MELKKLATLDDLTQLFNYKTAYTKLEEAILRAKENGRNRVERAE